MSTPEVPLWARIFVGYGCNNRCTFCHTLDQREISSTDAEVLGHIHRAAHLGCTMVVLSGGEPTVRPEVFHWATEIAALGMDLGLETNGRMLAYPAVAERLIGSRLRDVSLALHSATPAVHDAVTRTPGSFVQTVTALRNLSGRGVDVRVHAVVTRSNVQHIAALAHALEIHPTVSLRLSLARWKHAVVPPLAEAVRAVREVLDQRVSAGLRVTHQGFPLCVLPGHEARGEAEKDQAVLVAMPNTRDFVPYTRDVVPYTRDVVPYTRDVVPWTEGERFHPGVCNDCSLRGRCPGLDAHSPDRARDAGLLRAISTGGRSNSYNYTLEAVGAGAMGGSPEECPVWRDGPDPWDRGRVIFVETEGTHGREIGRYRTNTRDFTDGEIEESTHGRGQVYLDVSDKPAPDDFPRDLVQLGRSAVCGGCTANARCPGVWVAVGGGENTFIRDDARVREILTGLRGEVLDVGCGEGPYEDILGELARMGKITYAGIDPEREKVAGLQARWPWAKVSVGTAESLSRGVQVDHVLVLRSWNHMGDVPAAVKALSRAVRPGGTLTVVDNVAFGLVRSRLQSLRAERSGAVLEHHRTDGAEEAARALAHGGLELLERRDAGPLTSNQWLLRYHRPGESPPSGGGDVG